MLLVTYIAVCLSRAAAAVVRSKKRKSADLEEESRVSSDASPEPETKRAKSNGTSSGTEPNTSNVSTTSNEPTTVSEVTVEAPGITQ